jgi:hypothetical protein
MPNFFRLHNNQILNLGETLKLGWHINDAYQIPDEYIQKGDFTLMRLCNGLGDWGIISALPRLLKIKYPKCKIYVPSENMIQNIFKDSPQWKHWPNPEQNCYRIFQNNPYVDGFVDSVEGEIFHDHYRIYDDNINTPLIKQMMRFWGFNDNECIDLEPELYFSEEEIKEGNKLIENYIGDDEFGGFICISSQLNKGEFFEGDKNNKIIEKLKQNKLKYVYYGGVDIENTPFKEYINVVLDFNEIFVPLRIQLYIRSKAKLNIGYQSSMFELICRYSQIFCTEMISGPRENYFKSINYL